LILSKFVGDQNNLKTVSHGTNKIFTWKCDTIECLNTYKQSPCNIYRQDFPRKYCDKCSQENRYKNKSIAIIKRSGSIEDKYPLIKEIWSIENNKKPNEFAPGSNEKVKLKCPNTSAKHPEYEIAVHHIQEHTCFRCPKCITKSSNAEMRIYSELKYSFNDVKWQQKIEGREADITIEDVKLVIEIDGYPWHKDKSEKDLEKNIIRLKSFITNLKNYNLIHIHGNNYSIINNQGDPSVLEMTFSHIKYLNNFKRSNNRNYPINGLDYPNAKRAKDITLNFEN
jgi:very-short-patch-repair endonuclease